MLKFMRDHMGRTFLTIIVIAIAGVFVFMGVFPDTKMGGGLSSSEAASVGGQKISIQELQNAIQRDLENYRSMGVDLPKELMDNIKVGTLNNLISQKLMLVEAQRLGIAASDKEMMNEIQSLPYFQDKDKKTFSVEQYRAVLAANNMSPGQFEDSVRQSLTNQRMVKFLESRIRVTDLEVEREYKVSNETRNLVFVKFSREDALKKIEIPAKDVDAFLADKNRETQISAFYAQNNNKYNKPETVCARHILKRLAPGTKPDTSGKAPKEFLALSPSAGNFAAVAGKNSEDPGSKDKGGDLGCFGRGMMDKAFEAVAFTLPVGKISQPVLSQFGWHYITVYKKNPAVNIPLEVARREVAEEILKREKTAELQKITTAMAEEAAKNWPPKGDKVETTGSFNGLEGFIPKIGRADEILKAAFDPSAKIQTGPQIFESLGSMIVASVKEKKSADLGKFASEKEVHSKTLKERKLRAFLPAWMEDVKGRTKVSFNKGVIEQL